MQASDSFDHHSHMREALDLAENARERGDEPFGSVLVRDDTIIMRESNHVRTEADFRRHPELHLAYRAYRELSRTECRESALYTSAEPCPMCSGGIRIAELGRVIYSVPADTVAERMGSEPSVRCAEIVPDVTTVNGPFMEEEGQRIYHQ